MVGSMSGRLGAKVCEIRIRAALLITNSRKYDHITSILFDLHWLPVFERLKFKIIVLPHKALRQQSPINIHNLIRHYSTSGTLRSSFALGLSPVNFSPKWYGSRTFVLSAPEMWNKLPDAKRSVLVTI